MHIKCNEVPVFADPVTGEIRWDINDDGGEGVTHIITLKPVGLTGHRLTMETISYDEDEQDWLTVGETTNMDIIRKVVDPATLYTLV